MSTFQDYSKFLEGGLGQAELVGASGWQPPWRAPLQRKAPFYPGDDIFHADTWRELEVRNVISNEPTLFAIILILGLGVGRYHQINTNLFFCYT